MTEALVGQVAVVAKAAGATAILVPGDVLGRDQLAGIEAAFDGKVVPIVAAGHPELPGRGPCLKIPDVPLTRLSLIKIGVFLALSQGIISSGDVVVCLAGAAGSGLLDMLFIVEVGREAEEFSYMGEGSPLPKDLRPEVLARVVELAVGIGHEGREGKPVGALFVVGDSARVLSMSRPLVLNPFKGYDESERNILDPKLEETVKEFSSIDGAFIVRGDGVIDACGVFLKTSSVGEQLPAGLGARHHVAAGITAVTDALAISVSQSNGTATIFRGGRILSKIEKTRPP